MNKEEAIETIKDIDTLSINDMIAGQQVDMVIKNQVIDIISQIDESQKAVIPKFAANRIKYYKDRKLGLYRALASRTMSKELSDWLMLCENAEVFARAWLDGYEVEE